MAFARALLPPFIRLLRDAFEWFAAVLHVHELTFLLARGRLIALRPVVSYWILRLRAVFHGADAVAFACIFCHKLTLEATRNGSKPRPWLRQRRQLSKFMLQAVHVDLKACRAIRFYHYSVSQTEAASKPSVTTTRG